MTGGRRLMVSGTILFASRYPLSRMSEASGASLAGWSCPEAQTETRSKPASSVSAKVAELD